MPRGDHTFKGLAAVLGPSLTGPNPRTGRTCRRYTRAQFSEYAAHGTRQRDIVGKPLCVSSSSTMFPDKPTVLLSPVVLCWATVCFQLTSGLVSVFCLLGDTAVRGPARTGTIPGTGFQVSPLYPKLYRRRGPRRWWRPLPTQSLLSACSRSTLSPETSRRPRVSPTLPLFPSFNGRVLANVYSIFLVVSEVTGTPCGWRSSLFPCSEQVLVSVFCFLVPQWILSCVSLWVLSVYFPILFYEQVDLAYRGPCSVSWCRLRCTENLGSGLSPFSVSEMVGQRIQFTRQSVEAWEHFPTFSK